MKRQPRARVGGGGHAPSMKGKDPRDNRSQPVVAEDVVKSRALQRLDELAAGASTDDVRGAINEVIRVLRGEEER